MSCGVSCRRAPDPTLLWLWCRLAAAAPIGPLVWELPCAAGAALKRLKKKKKSLTHHEDTSIVCLLLYFPQDSGISDSEQDFKGLGLRACSHLFPSCLTYSHLATLLRCHSPPIPSPHGFPKALTRFGRAALSLLTDGNEDVPSDLSFLPVAGSQARLVNGCAGVPHYANSHYYSFLMFLSPPAPRPPPHSDELTFSNS